LSAVGTDILVFTRIARIAAPCRDHGVRELWTADRDFSRFFGITVVNPLLRDPTG
jgi:hypothetical protein